MRIINGCYDRTGTFTLVKNGVIIGNGIKMPEITSEIIEKSYIDENGIVVFDLPSVSENIKKCILDKISVGLNEIEDYKFDVMAAADGKKITFATIGISVRYKCHNSSDSFESDYDVFLIDFNDEVERNNLLHAVLLVYENC